MSEVSCPTAKQRELERGRTEPQKVLSLDYRSYL